MTKTRSQIKAGVILSYLAQALQIIITLLYTPVMLQLLGPSEYGIYQIVFSAISFLSLMTFGFAGSYIKFYSRANNTDNAQALIAKLNGTFIFIFLFLGLLVLVLGMWMAFNTECVLGGKLAVSELATAKILMFILVINCFLHFQIVVFNNYIIAHERFIVLQVINILGIILNPCLTFPLLLIGYGSISLGVVLLFITTTRLLISVFYSIKLRIKISFKELQLGLFKDVGVFSLYIFIESVVSMINISLDRFLLGKMVGSVATAVYAVGGQINTLYMSLSTSISSVFVPRINNMVEKGNSDRLLSDMFIRVGKIQFIVLYLVICGFIVFGRRFMALWVGDVYNESFYVAVLLIVPNTINLIQNVAYEIQRAKYLQKYRSLMYLGIAIMNIVVSIFLIRIWGASGAAMGTAMAWIIGSGVLMNWFYRVRVNLDVKRFWKEILILIRGGLLPLSVGLLLVSYVNTCSVVTYVLLISSFVLLYMISMYSLGLKKSDRFVVNGYVEKYLKRIKNVVEVGIRKI